MEPPQRPAAGFLLLLEVVGLLAPHVQEMAAKLLVLFVAGGPVQAHQGQLHLGMARAAPGVALGELLVDAVGVFPHDGQQAVLAGGLIVGAGGFHQVAGAVELVGLLQIGPLLVGGLHGEVGIQVAVLLLGLPQQGDDLVHQLLQLGVRLLAQGVGGSLQPLGHVAVLEHHAVEILGELLPPVLLGGQAQVF